jgi:sugar lactone lactonase YvrE
VIITEGLLYPDGIAFDQSGNMYVGNRFTEGTKSNGPGNVVIYASGSKSPSRTITNGVVSPVGITVDATGTLYVRVSGVATRARVPHVSTPRFWLDFPQK